jgi:hypothetical protein
MNECNPGNEFLLTPLYRVIEEPFLRIVVVAPRKSFRNEISRQQKFLFYKSHKSVIHSGMFEK